ncbi:MAG TPA: helix-turn-helix domain-containing protein [Terracidiphilus sp.]
MEMLLNETQLSEMLQVSLACLRRWRLRGEGPEYKKVGSLVRYRHEAVVQWVNGLPTGGNGRRAQPAAKLRNAEVLTADRPWQQFAGTTGLTITLLR